MAHVESLREWKDFLVFCGRLSKVLDAPRIIPARDGVSLGWAVAGMVKQREPLQWSGFERVRSAEEAKAFAKQARDTMKAVMKEAGLTYEIGE